MDTVRVRIAPSPSGFLHIGTAKMALFNWLFARKHGGKFILRLEDTDAERSSDEFATAMCEGFHWLGIEWDEGPEFGDVPEKGPYAPYRQSLRRDLHHGAALQLLDSGKAYRCYCTKEELDAERERAREEKRPPRYNGKCRNLTADAIAAKGDAPYVVRFRVPDGESVIDDMVQGPVRTQNREFDDFVILKSNGDPIFHLSVVVDDASMGITHIIRGDDHLTNAVRHIMLFDALGYEVPRMAHLPMVLDERGKKYSKREHGANVLDWRDDGYLPEALINYVALLGWTPAEEGRELFTRDELIEAFDETRWGASAAKFDRKKLDWLNGQHIRMMNLDDLRDRVLPILEREGYEVRAKSVEWLTRMAEICQEKIPTLNHIVQYTDFFFRDIADYEEKAVRKHWGPDDALEVLERIRSVIEKVDPWSHGALKHEFEGIAQREGANLGRYVHPARLALTGKSVGPGLFELTELLGRDVCLERFERAMAYVQHMKGASA